MKKILSIILLFVAFTGYAQNFQANKIYAKDSLIWNTGTNKLKLPPVKGSAGQVMTMPLTGNVLEWSTPSAPSTNYWTQTDFALYPNDSSWNVIIGSETDFIGGQTYFDKFAILNYLWFDAADQVAAFGKNAGKTNFSARDLNSYGSSYFGDNAGQKNTSYRATYVGSNSGKEVVNGEDAVIIGANAVTVAESAAGATIIGAGANENSNVNIGLNTVVGYYGARNATGKSIIALGAYAGYNNALNDRLYITNFNGGSEQGDSIKSILYGYMSGSYTDQRLTANAKFYLPLITAGGSNTIYLTRNASTNEVQCQSLPASLEDTTINSFWRPTTYGNIYTRTATQIGIGTNGAPEHSLSFAANSAQSIGINTRTTPNSAGNDLYLYASNATPGAIDKLGGALYYMGGQGTGNASGISHIWQTSNPTTSGSSYQSIDAKMTMLNTGYLGLGTTNPLSLFHIANSTAGAGISTYTTSTADAVGWVQNYQKSRGTFASPAIITTGDDLMQINFQGYDGSNYLSGAAIKGISSGTVASTRIPGALAFYTATNAAPSVLTERMRIDNRGYVGIGTSTPSEILEVNGNILIKKTGDSQMEWRGTGDSYFKYANAFRFFSSSGTPGERAILTAAGYMGLLTTTPSYLLSLGGDADRTIGMERRTTTGDAYGLTLLSAGAKSGETDKLGGTLTLSGGTSTGTGTSKIEFKTATAGSTGTADNAPSTKMTILGNGNVGIGTSTPAATLSIKTSGMVQSASISTDNNYVFLSSTKSILIEPYPTGSANLILRGNSGSLIFNDNSVSNLLINNGGGNIGIATTTPSYLLSLGGDADRTIGMERRTTTGTGYNLITRAGGVKSGETDKRGGKHQFYDGLSTGNATGTSFEWLTSDATTSGTANQAQTAKMTMLNTGELQIMTTTPNAYSSSGYGVTMGTGLALRNGVFINDTIALSVDNVPDRRELVIGAPQWKRLSITSELNNINLIDSNLYISDVTKSDSANYILTWDESSQQVTARNTDTWDDMMFPFSTGLAGGSAYPTFVADSGYYNFTVDSTGSSKAKMYMICQLPHAWKEGTTVYPHVHYKHTTTQGTPTFILRYKWLPTTGAIVPWTWIRLNTTTGTTNNTIQMCSNENGISGSGKTISSLLVVECYLYSQTGTGGISAYQFDVHIQKDSNGSYQPTSKY